MINEKIVISGKDLIRLGYEPASWFGKAIVYFNEHPELWLSDNVKEIIDGFIPKEPSYNTYMPLDKPVPYKKFIDTENDDELSKYIYIYILKLCLMDVSWLVKHYEDELEK